MADKLSIYNRACIHIEERQLASLTEACERRRVFDTLWNDVVGYCLAQGLWRFAKRVVQMDPSASIQPSFGYTSAYPIPDDWVCTVVISSVPELDPPLLQYNEETGYWFANCNPLFASFISKDPAYGMNLAGWPATFTEYVGLRLGKLSCGRIAGKADLAEGLQRLEDKERRNAKGRDAMNDPPGIPPMSMLARSRRGSFGGGFFGR